MLQKRIAFVLLLLFNLLIAESCQEEDVINPVTDDQAEISVIQRITNLGFAADDIKDMGTHYLVDGDIYFSKNQSGNETAIQQPEIMDGKYTVFTVRTENMVSGNDKWKNAVDLAIAKWNADEKQHARFILTTSANAHITIRSDNGELGEAVEIASEFAEGGRIGSTIRINLKNTGGLSPEEAAKKMFKALLRITGFHQPKNASARKPSEAGVSMQGARTQAVSSYVYIIWYDHLFRASKTNGSWSTLSDSWQGSSHMVLGTDGYLYVLQHGTLYWADPNNGVWGAMSSGWQGAQDMVWCKHDDMLYIIDGNKDLYRINPNSNAKKLIYDLGSRGTFRMTENFSGLSITDSYQNALYYLSFNNNGTVKTFTTAGKGQEWGSVSAITAAREYVWFVKGETLTRCYPELLPGETSRTKKIIDESDGRRWGGTVAMSQGSVSFNNPSGVSIFFLQNGSLYLKSDKGIQLLGLSGDWAGSILLACN